jgi:hypothetical protein
MDHQSLTEHENVKDCMACDDLIRVRQIARDLLGAHPLMFLFGVLFQLVIFKTVAILKARVMGAKIDWLKSALNVKVCASMQFSALHRREVFKPSPFNAFEAMLS